MVMIRNWHYDSSKPDINRWFDSGKPDINRWSDTRRPCWRGRIFCRDNEWEDVSHWLSNNLKQYDVTFRFNSGYPFYSIEIYEEHEALTFWMTWSE